MPSFDVVSEVDRQEVRNAVDQAQREINTRFDFKNTDSSIEQNELSFTLRSVSEDRLAALRVVLEEKLVKRGVSLKGLDYGKVEEATQNTVRQVATLAVGISSEKAREINKLIKSDGPKGVSSQTQGDTVRVASANRLHRITFTLISAHPLNRVLYALAETREPGPFLLQSLSDGRRAAGAVSYVEATPDSVKQGTTHNGLKWVIAIPQCKVT